MKKSGNPNTVMSLEFCAVSIAGAYSKNGGKHDLTGILQFRNLFKNIQVFGRDFFFGFKREFPGE